MNSPLAGLNSNLASIENEKNMRAHQGRDADEEVSFRVSEPQAYLQIATQESLAKNTLDQEEIEAHHSELI